MVVLVDIFQGDKIKKEVTVAKYSVYVFCDDCGDVHPMGIEIGLDDGPVKKASIGDAYKGKALPQNIVSMVNNYTQCPKTKKMILQRDNNQVFLVPVG